MLKLVNPYPTAIVLFLKFCLLLHLLQIFKWTSHIRIFCGSKQYEPRSDSSLGRAVWSRSILFVNRLSKNMSRQQKSWLMGLRVDLIVPGIKFSLQKNRNYLLTCLVAILSNIIGYIIVAQLVEHLTGDRSVASSRLSTRPCSAVSNVSDCRYVSDCKFRGGEFDPGAVPYFRGDWSWNNFIGHSLSFRWFKKGCCQLQAKVCARSTC